MSNPSSRSDAWRLRAGVPFVLAAVVGGLLTAAPQAGAIPAAAPSAPLSTVTGDWGTSIPFEIGSDSSFKAVDSLSPTDAWAVGATNLFTSRTLKATLVQHWDGTRWSVSASPNRSGLPSSNVVNSNVLNAVDAISSNNVWAVGDTVLTTPNNDFAGSGSLVEHYDGTSWTIVPSPNGVLPDFQFFNILLGVSGTAADDVWAVGWNGFIDFGGLHRPTIQHFDGTSWSLVNNQLPPIGNSAQNVVLESVTAVARNDVWATGFYSDENTGPFTHPLALHYDGTAWQVDNPVDVTLSSTFNHVNLNVVKATASNDVWAVGNVSYTDTDGNNQSQALIEHWDGTQWQPVRSPASPTGSAYTLAALAPFASDDIWALGTSGSDVDGQLLEHWDGTTWTVVPGPALDKHYNCGFFGAAATTGAAQAVGACVSNDPTVLPNVKPLAELLPGVPSAPPVDGTVPTPPINLVASATEDKQIFVTWNDTASTETGFNLERCQGNGCTNFVQVAVLPANANRFVDGPLKVNTTYTYRVRAFNGNGTSTPSNTASATVTIIITRGR